MDSISELLKSNETLVVDVRSHEEFVGGHVDGSINIPLNLIPLRVDELKGKGHIVLCCASGSRSGQATSFLRQYGIECTNAGAWTNVEYYKNN